MAYGVTALRLIGDTVILATEVSSATGSRGSALPCLPLEIRLALQAIEWGGAQDPVVVHKPSQRKASFKVARDMANNSRLEVSG